jgi:hypothetical protein
MFGDDPEVENPKSTSPVFATALDLAREEVLVAVVVADRRHHGVSTVSAKARQPRTVEGEAAHHLAGEVLGVGGAAAVAHEQQLVAAAKGLHAQPRPPRPRRS